jgi:hypothetical protein
MPIYLEIGEFYPCVIFEIARSDKLGTCAAARHEDRYGSPLRLAA